MNFIKTHIKPLFPGESNIVIQKTPNLRISFQNFTAIGSSNNDPEGIIGLHKDSDFGHNNEEINFVIPITNMYDTNSIYYEPFNDSCIPYEKYNSININQNEFIMIKFNNLNHYNKINNTGVTRLSLDFRVIPYSKYEKNIDFFKNTKFDINNELYYILF